MAAFADEYGTFPKTPPPRCAETEDMLTMRPKPCSIMSGRNALVTRYVPVALTAMTLFHRSSVVSRNGTGDVMPAMLASAPTGGNAPSATCAAIACCAAATDASSATLTGPPYVGTPYSAAMSAATRAARSPSRSRMAIAQPAFA